jgi:apolipoprotein N-acyltransferase
VHALAFPPWDLSVLAFVAVAPLLYLSQRLPPARAALAGHLWGSAAIWGVGGWVAEALTFYYQQPWWFGILFCLVGCQILWGLFYAAFAAAASGLTRGMAPMARVPAIGVLWVTCELARAKLLEGEPWMLLGYALIPDAHLIQAADLGGVYLLSFVVITVNAALAELALATERHRRQAWATAGLALALVAASWSYGAWRLGQTLPAEPRVNVTIVQGNNDLGWQWRSEYFGRGLERYLDRSRDVARQPEPRLLVWPESALTFFLAREPLYQRPIFDLLAWSGADLIAGAPHMEGSESEPAFYNSAFYLTSDRRLLGRYDKSHLLPFAEYFPLHFIELLRRNFERVRYFTAGDGTTLLPTRWGQAAVVICFEAIYPEIVRRQMTAGANLLVNLSNDVWLGRGIGQRQHLAMVTLRAVENRTWIVRSTTTGISAIIDPYGRVRQRSPLFEEAVLAGVVVPMQVETVYKRWGDVFAYGCLVAAALVAARGMLRRLRTGTGSAPLPAGAS